MFNFLSECFANVQNTVWARRTLSKAETCHISSFPFEWHVCNSPLDKELKELHVNSKKGIFAYRGDRRNPEEIFKSGFTFKGSCQDFNRLYCFNTAHLMTPGVCLFGFVMLNSFPCCLSVSTLAKCAGYCGCIVCSYLRNECSRFHPSKLLVMNLADNAGVSSVSVLSFAKTHAAATRYPLSVITTQPGREGFLYWCYLPAPTVDFDAYVEKQSKRRQRKTSSLLDDKEVFPLGAPVLSEKYIIGAWTLASEESADLTFLKERALLQNVHDIKPGSFKVNTSCSAVANIHELKNCYLNPSDVKDDLLNRIRNAFKETHL